jgi:hypothetical protein
MSYNYPCTSTANFPASWLSYDNTYIIVASLDNARSGFKIYFSGKKRPTCCLGISCQFENCKNCTEPKQIEY